MIVLVSALTACTTPVAYMGITLSPGVVDAGLQALARRAMAGDKVAQMGLGDRFASGTGVAADAKRARSLYLAAATASSGDRYIYIPATPGRKGHLERVGDGRSVAGLPEAAFKLRQIENDRGRADGEQ